VTQDYTGNRLINSPEFAFIGFVALPIPTNWGVITPRFDWSYKDEVFFSAANSELVAQAPLWLANLRVTYKSPDNRLELAGWIENVTDQAYTVDVLNLARLRKALLHAIGDPRTYGLTLTLRY
jgi:iron complex outermembrane receptor protein